MANTLHLILLISGFGLISCFGVTRKYHYIDKKMKWTDAQRYCRTKYTDLAIIENMDDVKRLNRPTADTSRVWIGLHDDSRSWKGIMGNDTNSWKWSTLGESSTPSYQNWGSGQPNNHGGMDQCVKLEAYGTWNDDACHYELFFVCYQDTDATGQKTYTLLQISSTWEDAQTYCRKHFTDLALIENEQENAQVQSVKSNFYVWIGLYRIAWRWSVNGISSFRNWHSGQPNNYYRDEYCVMEDSDRLWHDHSCGDAYPSWCFEAAKVKRVVTMKFQSHADLSDPAINTQLLQQISNMLGKQGWMDFKLQWRTPPRIEDSGEV